MNAAQPLFRNAATRALVLAFAAWLAFAIAASQHIHNAYWAAMPIWVVAQASRGLLLERALFRVVGTLLGAGAGFAMLYVPLPPLAQLALLGLWVAANAGLTHVLRGVQGYGAMLAGMTAAIVVIPSVIAPEGAMEIAVARVECTLIGVLVVTLVTGLFTPRSPRQALYARVRRLSGDAVRHARQVLLHGAAGSAAEERRILAEISAIEAAAPLVLAGSLEGYRRRHDIDALVVAMLSVMSAALALRQQGCASAALAGQLQALAAHLHDDAAPAAGRDPAGRSPDIHVLDIRDIHDLGAPPSPALARLGSGLRHLQEANAALRGAGNAAERPFRRPLAGLAPHREWSLAGRTGLLAGSATFVAAALGYGSGWPPLSLGAIGVCIFSMVLGSLALPQQVAPKLLGGVAAGVLVGTLFRLVVQPALGSTAGLLLAIAPFLLLGGIVRTNPRTAIAGVDANMCFLLASQAGTGAAATLAVALGDGLALLTAALLVAGSYILLPRRAELQAAEAAALIRRDLLRMLQAAAETVDWRARASRQVLRLALHLGRAQVLAERWPAGLLAVLNLGYAIETLQGMRFAPGELVSGVAAGVAAESTAGSAQAAAGAALRELATQPQATAQTLRRLAATELPTELQAVLRELADSLEQSAELLGFAAAA